MCAWKMGGRAGCMEEALTMYSLDLLFAELIKGITASLTRIAEGETKRHAEKIALAKRYVESTIWRTSLWKISVSTLALTLPILARFSRKNRDILCGVPKQGPYGKG